MSVRYYVINEADLKNIYVTEATDNNKIAFDTDSYYVEFALLDTEYDTWKDNVTAMVRYVNQDGYTSAASGSVTNIANNIFNVTETESFLMDVVSNKIYMLFTCTKATQTYVYKIYMSKAILDSVDNEVDKMIEKTLPENLISSGSAGNDGTNNFVLFATTTSQNLKIYIQSGLLAGFKTDLDAENTAMQATTGDPPEYVIEQTASGVSAKNNYSETYQQNSINTIIVQKDEGNNSAIIFTGNDVDGYEVVLRVLLNRDDLDAFNTQVQALT
jgi:hypothetical protein